VYDKSREEVGQKLSSSMQPFFMQYQLARLQTGPELIQHRGQSKKQIQVNLENGNQNMHANHLITAAAVTNK